MSTKGNKPKPPPPVRLRVCSWTWSLLRGHWELRRDDLLFPVAKGEVEGDGAVVAAGDETVTAAGRLERMARSLAKLTKAVRRHLEKR